MLPYERLQACVAAIRQKTDFVPRTALVLGSGLGGFGERLALEAAVDYKDIPGFPVSTVPGHQGRFLLGYVEQEPVVVMQGRVHYYEGYPMEDVVLPIRVMGLLGAKRLVLTNAAGGIGPGLEAGDLMLLTGHIAAFVPSPLIGPQRGRGRAGHPPEGRGVLADHRPPVRDTGGNPHVRGFGRQRRGHEHRL